MFEVVIIIVIAVAVWLFVRYQNKADESVAGASVEPVVAPKISIEPEPEVKAALKTEPEAIKTIEVNEVAEVVPEDSTLRRHYLHNLSIQGEISAVADEESAEAYVTEDSIVQVSVVEGGPAVNAPEDVVLKRDHIQQLVAEIEATMPPRPTDSTLKRHYDTQLMSLVLSQLHEKK